MQAESLKNIVRNIQRMKSETQNIELKAAAKGCPTRWSTQYCDPSFSNQDEGGIILFGIDEERGYTVNGVYDPQDIRKKGDRAMQANAAAGARIVHCMRN